MKKLVVVFISCFSFFSVASMKRAAESSGPGSTKKARSENSEELYRLERILDLSIHAHEKGVAAGNIANYFLRQGDLQQMLHWYKVAVDQYANQHAADQLSGIFRQGLGMGRDDLLADLYSIYAAFLGAVSQGLDVGELYINVKRALDNALFESQPVNIVMARNALERLSGAIAHPSNEQAGQLAAQVRPMIDRMLQALQGG